MKYDSFELQDVCSFIDYRGKTPPKTASGIPLITAKIIKNGQILPSQEYIAESYYSEWMRRGIPKKGAIVLTTEAPLGEVAQIDTDKKLAFAQRVIILEPDERYLVPDYLLYALQDVTLKERIHAKATGTTVLGIKSAELKKVQIDLPSVVMQRKISSILKDIDRKIRCNQTVNDNLSDLLQTIYQGQFGKVGLANNCGILADICSYSKDKIEISKLSLDTYYSTENMLPEKSGAVKATSLPTTSQTTACHKGDTLISNIRPYFKKIVYCEDDCGCSTDVLCFKPAHPRYTAYLFSTLYADSFFDFMVAGAKGTKMPRGDKQQIMTYPVVLPSEKDLSEFNSVATPILTQIYSNRTESERLSAIRDTLLPKLILGEIDVSSIQL